jgi:glycosyltransferase involved in cell wall biosynthesis
MRSSFHQVLASPEIGGAGLIALRLASLLEVHGQDSHVWIPGEGAAQRQAADLGLRTHAYDMTGLFSPSKIKAIASNLSFWRKLYAYSPDLIHIHSPFHYRALRFALEFSRSMCVVHVHIEENEDGLRWAFKRPPDVIITCARFLVQYVQRLLPEQYQQRQRIVAVSNPVDIEAFRPGNRAAAKRHVGAALDTPLVLMLANLAPHKGQEVAIRVTAALKKAGVNIVLWLAGVERGQEVSYTAQLRALCAELDVHDRVHLLGQRQDVPELLRAADVFLLPSTHEGLPLSVLEAQASKVPVLAAPTGGIPEIVIDGETGFLIAPGAVASYAERIKNLLDNPELYQYVTEHAYAKITQEYSWRVYSEHIWQLYQEIMTTSLRHPNKQRNPLG